MKITEKKIRQIIREELLQEIRKNEREYRRITDYNRIAAVNYDVGVYGFISTIASWPPTLLAILTTGSSAISAALITIMISSVLVSYLGILGISHLVSPIYQTRKLVAYIKVLFEEKKYEKAGIRSSQKMNEFNKDLDLILSKSNLSRGIKSEITRKRNIIKNCIEDYDWSSIPEHLTDLINYIDKNTGERPDQAFEDESLI